MNEQTLALLRRFEPILRYTGGEKFFPIDVERYVNECSLWVKEPNKPARELIPQGALTIADLAKPQKALSGSIFFLKFIDPLDLLDWAKYSINQAIQKISHLDQQDSFRLERGRLARVGYGSRLVDALFSVTLFLRGRVPGDTAAAAALAYQRLQQKAESYCYYGRVIRENNWIVLQYWYFYPFNNWRSGFRGVNDHEGDWEMISVYCSEPLHEDGSNVEFTEQWVKAVQAEWVAYASHDFSGDDLRRRWDDPEVEKIGEHPVVYVGAGSHASYYQPGEYMAELELPFLKPFVRMMDFLQKLWVNFLHQSGSKEGKSEFNVFRIPFIDYARGDGKTIGADQERTWETHILNDETAWAVQYRGLWGLYADDPIAGENAPAGPIYNRDGSFRRSWIDPLGWAGLDKVPPRSMLNDLIDQQSANFQNQIVKLEKAIHAKSQELQSLGALLLALEDQCSLQDKYQEHQNTIVSLSQELARLKRELAETMDIRQALIRFGKQIQQGYREPARAHIQRELKPLAPANDLNFLTELIAAFSIGLLFIGFVTIWLFARHYFLIGLAALMGALIFVEASFRRQLSRLINSLSIGLAIISFFVLIFQFFWQIVIAGVFLVGLYLLWDNIRELRR